MRLKIGECNCHDTSNQHKPSQWPTGSGCGAHILYLTGIKTGYICYREENGWSCDGTLYRMTEETSVTVPTNSGLYCICGGPTEHIKYTTFEYDLCLICRKEKK